MHNLFNECSNHSTSKQQRTSIQNTQVAVYVSDTPVTLKQSQAHQTYNVNVDPKQGFNCLKFERSCFHSVPEKGNDKGFFFKQGNMSFTSLEHVQNSKVVKYSK